MEKIAANLIGLTIMTSIFYGFGVFTALDFNPVHWDALLRFVVGGLVTYTTIVALAES